MVTQLSPAVQEDYRRDLLANEAPAFIDAPTITPVWPVGGGVSRPGADQTVRTFAVVKQAIAVTQTQVATAGVGRRIYFLGIMVPYILSSSVLDVEDADSGSPSLSDNSEVALFHVDGTVVGSVDYAGTWVAPYPRECKRGIRVQYQKGGTTNEWCIIYYLVERTDGQQQPV